VNEINEGRLRALLKEALGPADLELRRDLWPEMVRRMEQGERRVPWFDWALLAAATACLLFVPQMIPMLLYHL
jgi:hypothetical protein